jgi:hypothetical protein
MKKVCNIIWVCFLIVGYVGESVGGSEIEAFAPDRPGLSTGTFTVSPGTIYLEAGYQYEFNRSGLDTATHTLPQVVIRTGISDKVEIDLIWDGFNQDHLEGFPSETSRADVILGGKYRLVQTDTINLTFLGLITVPIGSAPSTSDNTDPLIGLLWDYGLSENIELFGVFQTTQIEDDNENDFIENQYGIGLGYSVSDRLSSFIEYFTAFPVSSQQGEQHIIDAGVTYLYGQDIQFDVSAGVGLNDETSHFLSVGVAKRF